MRGTLIVILILLFIRYRFLLNIILLIQITDFYLLIIEYIKSIVFVKCNPKKVDFSKQVLGCNLTTGKMLKKHINLVMPG